MNAITLRMMVCLTMLAVSVHGLAALTNALRGPAHHHPANQTTAPRADHAHATHPHHAHDRVQRHYHLPGDGVILVLHEHAPDDAPAESTNSRGESVSAAFVALISSSPQIHPPQSTYEGGIDSFAKLRSCPLRRIERPPRSLLA